MTSIMTALAAIHHLQEQKEELEHEKLLLLINYRITQGDTSGRLNCEQRWFRWELGVKVEIYRSERNRSAFYFSCSIQYLCDLEEKWEVGKGADPCPTCGVHDCDGVCNLHE